MSIDIESHPQFTVVEDLRGLLVAKFTPCSNVILTREHPVRGDFRDLFAVVASYRGDDDQFVLPLGEYDDMKSLDKYRDGQGRSEAVDQILMDVQGIKRLEKEFDFRGRFLCMLQISRGSGKDSYRENALMHYHQDGGQFPEFGRILRPYSEPTTLMALNEDVQGDYKNTNSICLKEGAELASSEVGDFTRHAGLRCRTSAPLVHKTPACPFEKPRGFLRVDMLPHY